MSRCTSVREHATGRNGEASSRSQYSYNNLFKLDSLLNLQLPHGAYDNHSCSSSQDERDSARGSWRVNGHANGTNAERPSDVQSEMTMKRKRVQVEADAGCNSARRDDSDSNDEDGRFGISEDHYRAMLGEHLQRYKRARLLEAVVARTSVTTDRKQERAKSRAKGVGKLDANGIDSSMNQNSGFAKQYVRKNRMKKVQQDGKIGLVGSEPPRAILEHMGDVGIPKSGLLDLGGTSQFGGNVQFQVPPSYDRVGPLLNLPDYEVLENSEGMRSGNNESILFLPMGASDPTPKLWHGRGGMGELWDEGQNLSSTLNQRFLEDGVRKYSLKVLDRDITAGECSNRTAPAVFEESQQRGPTVRQISSDGGSLKLCEVKIIEQGEGFEIIQRRVEKKELKRDAVAKEDFEKIGRHWASLVRKDLPKHHKVFMAYHKKQLQDTKRCAEFCQREVKTRNMRSLKMLRGAPARMRRLARDMVIFWKKMDKEQAELRRKEEKDAADALKREEELREAKRQQQRLNFLLTQTELYSHFMQNKSAGGSTAASDPAAATMSLEEDAEEAALKEEALRVATQAANQQISRTNAFDSESSKLRQSAVVESGDQEAVPVDAVGDIDLLNPSTMPITSSVQQPKLFRGILKEYQLKGLQWLVNCYEQGLNGILADEMGLGKTIQAMAFLAHLSEEKNIWGPFLVVAPASVLNNWADEVNRFCPDLKILPYWGGLNERTVLRKNINPKRLYKREAGFHVLITSYQLLVSDEKYLRRVKWQYMILDEAQAIKSANSLRWKTLLSFNCRNRLLLTGTPIQNSMAELWALLHFIMPTLFDSHEQFSEWFSKGIESHAEHGGTLNEHQLTRLHAILKPFMLRRVKKDVITEMSNKKELMVPCLLSKRQLAFYQAIKNKISVADLFDSKGAMNEKKVLNLMNIVIQLRKVCNHPELFERNEGHSFLQFSAMTNSLLPPTFGELEDIHYCGAWNPISYKVPKLLYQDGMHCLPTSCSGSCQGFLEKWLRNRFSIYSPDHIHDSIFHHTGTGSLTSSSYSGFGFSRFLNLAPCEVEFLAKASMQERWLYSVLHADSPSVGTVIVHGDTHCDGNALSNDDIDDPKTRVVKKMLMVPLRSELTLLYKKHPTASVSNPFKALVISHKDRFLQNVGLLRAARTYIRPAQAPQIDVVCSDRGFTYQRTEELEDPWIKRLLVGFARTSESGPALPRPSHSLVQEEEVKLKVQEPLLALPFRVFGSAPPVQSFDFAKMLTDSGKLHVLDGLLKRLKAGSHRILLFAQMTKMLNILEDYMNYRKYKYLRLDGSSTIMDRRDMVKDFQLKEDIFVFLLSTRAGGLGINLTAADTVIFYESDWNPTMDLQAMDRAHRLGQTKEVTVYRMICKGTVEEKIMKRASQKNTVQQLVMTGGQSQGDVFQAEEVVSLLLDDAELEQKLKDQQGSKQAEKAEKRRKGWVGTGVKAVRLDAEGGGASLDEEAVAGGSNGPQAPQEEGSKDTVGDGGNSEAATQDTVQGGGKKRRRGEAKAPKPPKAPKERKPPKEPKVPRERKQPRAPRPPRDPRLPRAKGRSTKKSNKSVGIEGVSPGEGMTLLSAIPGGSDQSHHMNIFSNGEVGAAVNSELAVGNTTVLSIETHGTVPGKMEQDKRRGGNKKKAVEVSKGSSRPSKRLKKDVLELSRTAVAGGHKTVDSNSAHPSVETLPPCLQEQTPVDISFSSVPADDLF